MRLAAASAGRKQKAWPKPTAAHCETVRTEDHARALLAWYDRHRRVLPWRALPGERPDPYRVWLSEIMLQQTTVRAVAPYFERFVQRWPNLHALAAATLDDVLKLWAGLGYYARARHLHACAKAVVEHNSGFFPQSEAELAKLPGVGAYTAAAIAAIAFDARTVAIDGNAERVLARFFALEQELPGAKARLRELAQSLLPASRSGDFAQALMDLGASICTPKKPACALCPWMHNCRARGAVIRRRFPARRPSERAICAAARLSFSHARTAPFCCARAQAKVCWVAWLKCRPPSGQRISRSRTLSLPPPDSSAANPIGAAFREWSRTPLRIFRWSSLFT